MNRPVYYNRVRALLQRLLAQHESLFLPYPKAKPRWYVSGGSKNLAVLMLGQENGVRWVGLVGDNTAGDYRWGRYTGRSAIEKFYGFNKAESDYLFFDDSEPTYQDLERFFRKLLQINSAEADGKVARNLKEFAMRAGVVVFDAPDPKTWGGKYCWYTTDAPNCKYTGFESEHEAYLDWAETTFGELAATELLKLFSQIPNYF